MDKIMAICFSFPEGDMLCAGADWAIADLYNNFIIQRDNGNNVEHEIWCERITNNHIYGRFEPKGIRGIYMCLLIYLRLKNNKLWITKSAYAEALYLSEQEYIGQLLEITEQEAERIKRETFWKGKFLY